LILESTVGCFSASSSLLLSKFIILVLYALSLYCGVCSY
jgi:hypothetical protein